MHAGLIGVVLTILTFCPQADPGSPEPQRYATLPQIVEGIATSVKKNEGALVIWLLDSAPNSADLFSQSVGRSFSGSKTSHAVVAFEKTPRLVLKATLDLGAVTAAIRTAMGAPAPDADIRNCLLNIRGAAALLAGASTAKKTLVFFAPVDADNEDDIEATVAALKRSGVTFHAIAPEALTSDTYWKRHAPPAPVGKAGTPALPRTAFKGAEGAFVEFPWGWPLGAADPASLVPSGFGIWALSRLAGQTGGRYSFYAEEGEADSFCRKEECPLCRGLHQLCGAEFDELRLKLVRSDLGSRTQYVAHASRDPLLISVAHFWARLYQERMVQGAPDLLVKKGQLVAAPETALKEESLALPALLESIRNESGPAPWGRIREASLRHARDLDGLSAELLALSRDKGVRAGLLEAVGILGGGSIIPSLLKYMDDPQQEVARAAAEIVFKKAGRSNIPSLRKLLKHDRAEYRVSAAESLFCLDTWDGYEVMAAELKDTASAERERVIGILGCFRRRESIDLLVERLEDGDARVSAKARTAIVESLASLFPYLAFDAAASAETIRTWWTRNRPGK